MTIKPLSQIFTDLRKIIKPEEMLYNILSVKDIDESVMLDEYLQQIKENLSDQMVYPYPDMFYRVFIYCVLMQDPKSPLVLSPIGSDSLMCKKAATSAGLLILNENNKFPREIERIIIGGDINAGGLMVYILKASCHFEYAVLRTSYFQFMRSSWETFTTDEKYDAEAHKTAQGILNDVQKNIKSFKESVGDFKYDYLKTMLYNSMNDELNIMPHQISNAIKNKRLRQVLGD
jgi:hypothetical protein